MNHGKLDNSIRRLRAENAGMTQAELAGQIGVSRQTIIAVEQGKYSPSLETAFLIARVLGKPLTDVFTYGPSE
ncbi:helix-turn-helix transcriptional regulator [Paeniglutamicibacter sp. MACA_103]|uniref:helix-turn-helix transcriptional regulator n=1 Tax=Paeniglutamicibacter sp. MACA_103 TaxID=3377337 RepID=UPI00389347F0